VPGSRPTEALLTIPGTAYEHPHNERCFRTVPGVRMHDRVAISNDMSEQEYQTERGGQQDKGCT
jgi:hypothetical protein